MSNTPRTDEWEEADSYAFQILYPHQKYRGVKGERCRALERELAAAQKEIAELKEANQDDHDTLQLLRTVLKDEWQEGDDGEADVVVRILNRRDQLKRWYDEVYDYGRNPADKETAWFLKAEEISAERDRLRAENAELRATIDAARKEQP